MIGPSKPDLLVGAASATPDTQTPLDDLRQTLAGMPAPGPELAASLPDKTDGLSVLSLAVILGDVTTTTASEIVRKRVGSLLEAHIGTVQMLGVPVQVDLETVPEVSIEGGAVDSQWFDGAGGAGDNLQAS